MSDDTPFLLLIQSNPEKAFEWLVDNYSDKLYHVILQYLRNEEDSKDILQETYLSIFKNLNTFKKKSKVSTWIYAIAINKSKEFIRNKTRQKRSGINFSLDNSEKKVYHSSLSDFNHPGIILENKEKAIVFYAALDQLSENQKNAYILNKIEGLSYDEVSENLNLSKSSIESLLFRAKKKLQEILKNQYRNASI